MIKLAHTLLLHKWFVLVAGLRLQVPLWRLLVHDLSKFSPQEFPHYARRFYGANDDPDGFALCWAHHLRHNPHHWQHWVVWDEPPLPMPWWAVREMVADWQAAGRAYNGQWPDPNAWAWYDNHQQRMLLHPLTRQRLTATVAILRARSEGK